MKGFLLLTTLLLSVIVCRGTSGCQEVKSPVCTADIGVSFFPHETDCALFYVCNHGSLSTHACLPGKYFMDQNKLCVDSKYVRCDRCNSNSNKAQCGECCCCETTTPPPCVCDSTTYQPSTTQVFCPPIPECSILENGISKPYPPDCEFHIYCAFGSPELRKCKTGFEFSPTLLKCVDAALADCPVCISNYQ